MMHLSLVGLEMIHIEFLNVHAIVFVHFLQNIYVITSFASDVNVNNRLMAICFPYHSGFWFMSVMSHVNRILCMCSIGSLITILGRISFLEGKENQIINIYLDGHLVHFPIWKKKNYLLSVGKDELFAVHLQREVNVLCFV